MSRRSARRLRDDDTAPECSEETTVEHDHASRIAALEDSLNQARQETSANFATLRTDVSNEISAITNGMHQVQRSLDAIVGHLRDLHREIHAHRETHTSPTEQTTSQQLPETPSAAPTTPTIPTAANPSPQSAAAPQNDEPRQFVTRPLLRIMDTKPPLFEGEINGMKLNSFIFQFEQYYSQKGYDLVRHDSFVGLELNQSVSKTALTWFERYMTDPDTAKTWSAMKQEMMIKFREPNFTDRMQNQLLTIRQRGKSGGYVAKFRDLQRIVCLDSQTTKNIFINGLSDSALRQNILRKQPRDLHEAIKEGFLECEIARKNLVKETTEANTIKQSDPKKHNTNSTTKPSAKAKTPTDSRLPRVTCPHYQRGYHKQEDCWQLHPEKRPKGASGKPDDIKKIYSMLEQLIVNQADAAVKSTPHLN